MIPSFSWEQQETQSSEIRTTGVLFYEKYREETRDKYVYICKEGFGFERESKGEE